MLRLRDDYWGRAWPRLLAAPRLRGGTRAAPQGGRPGLKAHECAAGGVEWGARAQGRAVKVWKCINY